MLGYILKFGSLLVIVMVVLNIFLPEETYKILNIVSEYSHIESVTLEEALDSLTEFIQNTFLEVQKQIHEIL